MTLGFIWCLSLFLAYYQGWVVAHKTVAHECKTLGGFYVGKQTFKCIAMERKSD